MHRPTNEPWSYIKTWSVWPTSRDDKSGREQACCGQWSVTVHGMLLLHCVSKKVPTFKLSVTLSNLNRFSEFVHCWKAYEICYKMVWHYLPHLRHVATLPWEIKNSNFLQIFSTMEENANKLHFKCTDFNSSACNCVYYWRVSLAVLVIIHYVSKKVPSFELPVILSNLNRFSKFLHCWKAH